MSDKPKFIIVSREDLERAIMQALRRSKLDIDGDEAQRIVLRTLAYLPVTGPVPQFETLPTHCECAPRECKGEGIFRCRWRQMGYHPNNPGNDPPFPSLGEQIA